MNRIFIILLMIFCHIIDDFVLQHPLLCNLKQKSYWERNAPDEMYKRDYIWALIMHSFSWTFMIMLPIAAFIMKFNLDFTFMWAFTCNMIIHAMTDNAKANRKIINLWQDQLIHITQIALTALVFFIHQG